MLEQLSVNARLWTYSLHRAEDIRDPMNLKPNAKLNLFSDESRVIAGDTRTQTRESSECLNSQSRAIAGRADHQHSFFPSIRVWENFMFMAGIAMIAFSPSTAAMNVLSGLMKVHGSSTHLSNYLLSKHNLIDCKKPILLSSLCRYSKIFLLVYGS
ncbi:hypothetical protein TNCV_2867711 [Trichonephila clavipes]|nr:hypothetical protein TNCV_2867711 [Trichonephila clavipes]